ncbi:MAG TPA: hypothetical protein VF320_07845, partial [Acidimicrobiales bacterium]
MGGRESSGGGSARRSPRRNGRDRRIAWLVTAAVALSAVACSSGTGGSSSPPTTGGPGSTGAVARPAGPAADLSQELTGGNGVFMGAATSESLQGTGYVQHEYVATGTAT